MSTKVQFFKGPKSHGKTWELVAEGQECFDPEGQPHIIYTENEEINSVDGCATKCKSTKASMFSFGTLDYGDPGCNDKGCQCICEISASKDGSCKHVINSAVRLYKYKLPSKCG